MNEPTQEQIEDCKWRMLGRMRLEQYHDCDHPDGQNKLRKCPYRGSARFNCCALWQVKEKSNE